MREFYVSRQSYWHEDGTYAVEIARELDYSGPGALGVKYASLGEGCEFTDPREAAKAAIAVREAWLGDLCDRPRNEIPDVALTLAMNDLVYPVTDDGMTPDELIAWADKIAESMPRCEHCGDICESEGYMDEYGERFSACSDYHAELSIESSYLSSEDQLAAEQTPQYDDDGNEIVEIATCGTCGRSWNDAAVSSRTPAPAGRCPFEYNHESEE